MRPIDPCSFGNRRGRIGERRGSAGAGDVSPEIGQFPFVPLPKAHAMRAAGGKWNPALIQRGAGEGHARLARKFSGDLAGHYSTGLLLKVSTSISFAARATMVAFVRLDVTFGTVRIMSRKRSNGRMKPTITAA